jgi:3-isopropylmalate dehydrogenase
VSFRRRFVVACLTGNGIGPEVMAEASRALAQVSRLHGFLIDEVHPPFGAEATVRSGHALPTATRSAALGADAVLAAGASEPALDGVRAGLDLHVSATRVLRSNGSGLTLFAPLGDEGPDWAVERAFLCARSARGRLANVGIDSSWRDRVAAVASRHDGVEVDELCLADALSVLARASSDLDVVVTERALADALAEAPALGGTGPVMRASGFLSPGGPGLFVPSHGSAHDIAGQGVANPSEMLLAAALLLGEGLGRHAAAQTLESSLAGALGRPARTPDLSGPGKAAGTREFVDVVLGLLPTARADTEFALGGAA